VIEFNHIFRLDGVPHDRDSLSALCAQELERKETEPWRRELCSFLLSWIDPEVTEFEQLTSGTTGRPRRYMLDRDAMIRSATNTLSHFNLQPGSGALLCLPVRYIAGKMMAVRALVGQLDLVTVEPS
jgi:O-succinylbenzoic acid--CoA ligase